MSTDNSERIKTALEHHQRGQLQQAESIYQSILQQEPEHVDALHLLGVLAMQVGRPDAALPLIEKAVSLRPEEPEFHNMCGEAYRASRDLDRAIASFRRALEIRPNFAGAHMNLGNALQESGAGQEAIRHYRLAIDSDPNFPLPFNNLGLALRDSGELDEALRHFEQATRLAPDYAEAHTNLGTTKQALGRTAESLAHHQRALELRPDFAEAHGNLGNALRALGQLQEALAHYRRALELQPGDATAHYNLGIVLDELGRPRDAVEHYQRALQINPAYAAAHNNLANAFSELGDRDAAVRHYGRAIDLAPEYAEAHRNLARVAPREARRQQVETLLADESLSPADAVHCHFALGSICNDAQDFDTAFRHYAQGNRLKRATISYDPAHASAYVDRLIEVFSPDYFAAVSSLGKQTDVPVFIVGMPRSGTSLVEQIVSSHPQVCGAGELDSMRQVELAIAERIGQATGYPDCMPAIDASTLGHFANAYLDELRGHSQDAAHVTDKMPDNFLRLGLIRTLFPRAQIVHCRRNALDTCLSNYFNYFATGNEYSFDLADLGHFYLDYERLMAHWARVFESRLVTVRYEDLVRDQEATTRSLIGDLGLTWDSRCLEYYRNDRAVNTFSSLQVRQPVYAGAVDRWKPYARHLGPLVELLPAGE